MNSQLIGKDPDVGKDWSEEEKGTTEDEIVGWHHWLDGHEFEPVPGDGEGQGSLVCYSPLGHIESDTNEWLSNNNTGLTSATCIPSACPCPIRRRSTGNICWQMTEHTQMSGCVRYLAGGWGWTARTNTYQPPWRGDKPPDAHAPTLVLWQGCEGKYWGAGWIVTGRWSHGGAQGVLPWKSNMIWSTRGFFRLITWCYLGHLLDCKQITRERRKSCVCVCVCLCVRARVCGGGQWPLCRAQWSSAAQGFLHLNSLTFPLSFPFLLFCFCFFEKR